MRRYSINMLIEYSILTVIYLFRTLTFLNETKIAYLINPTTLSLKQNHIDGKDRTEKHKLNGAENIRSSSKLLSQRQICIKTLKIKLLI